MMNIRQATGTDIPSIVKLVNSGYRGEVSKKGWTSEADLLDGIRTNEEALSGMLYNPYAVILIAEEHKELIGCVYLERQDDTLYLGMLTVNPELLGNGIGAQLMHTAECYANEFQLKKIKMTVITLRVELVAYYKRKGYKDTGERKPFEVEVQFGVPKKDLEFMVIEKYLT